MFVEADGILEVKNSTYICKSDEPAEVRVCARGFRVSKFKRCLNDVPPVS